MISLVCGNGKLTKQLSHMYFFTIARAFAPHLDLITKRDRAGKTSASDELSHNTKKKKKFGGSYSALSPKSTNFQDAFRLRVSGL